jgi:hypothetical protein
MRVQQLEVALVDCGDDSVRAEVEASRSPAVVTCADNGWLYAATYTLVTVPCFGCSSLQAMNGFVEPIAVPRRSLHPEGLDF